MGAFAHRDAGNVRQRLGIIGLGNIGLQIAKRCAGGFDMPVGYFNRRPLDDSPYQYFSSREALARWADYLVIATPGGKTLVGWWTPRCCVN